MNGTNERTFSEGQHISGTYQGQEFSGTVTFTLYNRILSTHVLEVELDNPISVWAKGEINQISIDLLNTVSKVVIS
jgi:hypothetical protein